MKALKTRHHQELDDLLAKHEALHRALHSKEAVAEKAEDVLGNCFKCASAKPLIACSGCAPLIAKMRSSSASIIIIIVIVIVMISSHFASIQNAYPNAGGRALG